MASIPFLILHLINIAILVAIPVLYTFVALCVGKLLARNRHYRLGFIFAMVALLAPTGILINGYLSFKSACSSQARQINSKVSDPVSGFYLKAFRPELGDGVVVNSISDAPFRLLESQIYDCLTYAASEGSSIVIMTRDGHKYGDAVETGDPIPVCDGYSFEITTPKPVSWMTRPYHKTSEIIISRRVNGEILAHVTEQLYGGGLIARYRKYLGDWSNDNYSACGYVSEEPQKWRTANDAKARYLTADTKLITSVLRPKEKTSP
jgi:hypothetical protein